MLRLESMQPSQTGCHAKSNCVLQAVCGLGGESNYADIGGTSKRCGTDGRVESDGVRKYRATYTDHVEQSAAVEVGA